jgi:toxin-antitoxin system PIN domain toxin
VTTLLDCNVLIALLVADHVHHKAAESWLVHSPSQFATCPVTQGALVRLLVRNGQPAEAARTVVEALMSDERHEFWPDEVPYSEVAFDGVIGHRQVTDAYLAQLARARGARLATFDQGFAKLHADVVDLLPADAGEDLADPGRLPKPRT